MTQGAFDNGVHRRVCRARVMKLVKMTKFATSFLAARGIASNLLKPATNCNELDLIISHYPAQHSSSDP